MLECLAEHIVKVTAIQMIGCSQRLRLGIEYDASLRAVVPHLDLHTAVAGSGREKKHFVSRFFRLFGTLFMFLFLISTVQFPLGVFMVINFLLKFAIGKYPVVDLFQQITSCLRNALVASGGGNAETVEMGRILFVIIDAECGGQYGTQCGEVGEKGKILFTITFLFEDTFVQQIGQIFVHAFGKTGRFFSEFFALPIRFICFIDVFGWAICHFCHFVLMKRRAKRRGGDGWSRGNFLVTRL